MQRRNVPLKPKNSPEISPSGSGKVRFCKGSDQSLLVYFEEESTLDAHRRVAASLQALEQSPIAGVRNLNPAFRSLLVKFDALRWTHEKLEAELRARFENLEAETAADPPVIEIPVCYGGEFGPDLEDVARLHGITEQEVISAHAGSLYRVFFLGFVPGFAYLGDLPEELATPRLATPRKLVAAGSVGIAGRQTGVYPRATPGGWRLLGRTPLKMFRKERAGMSLLRLGDRVKFVPIARQQFAELENA